MKNDTVKQQPLGIPEFIGESWRQSSSSPESKW
jgi:hypothetical protein